MEVVGDLLAESSMVTEYLVRAIASIDLNWIGKIIRWIIEGVGITALGVVVFTVALKTIVLPLDIYSRVKQRKQSLIMKDMRPQMEKLQKQYANDKSMYNQKVSELQKKNGYSAFSACVPTLVSLIIFLIVFSQFSTYSQYANLESYNDMVQAYNGSVISYVVDGDVSDEERVYYFGDENYGTPTPFLIAYNELTGTRMESGVLAAVDWFGEGENFFGEESENLISVEYMSFYVDFEAFEAEYIRYYTAYYSYEENLPEDWDGVIALPYAEGADEIAMLDAVDLFVEGNAAQAVYDYYYLPSTRNRTHFLWVGNIWYPDSMLNKEVPSFSSFKSAVSRAEIGDYESSYNKVTAALEKGKNRYNGYFILIVLAIGLMLLQQFISSRSNKDANEMSTVNGQGAKTSKYMMIIMPIIYGIFSFFYSASFSLYMITNTTYSIISALIINRVVNVRYSRKRDREELERLTRPVPEKKEAET